MCKIKLFSISENDCVIYWEVLNQQEIEILIFKNILFNSSYIMSSRDSKQMLKFIDKQHNAVKQQFIIFYCISYLGSSSI